MRDRQQRKRGASVLGEVWAYVVGLVAPVAVAALALLLAAGHLFGGYRVLDSREGAPSGAPQSVAAPAGEPTAAGAPTAAGQPAAAGAPTAAGTTSTPGTPGTPDAALPPGGSEPNGSVLGLTDQRARVSQPAAGQAPGAEPGAAAGAAPAGSSGPAAGVAHQAAPPKLALAGGYRPEPVAAVLAVAAALTAAGGLAVVRSAR